MYCNYSACHSCLFFQIECMRDWSAAQLLETHGERDNIMLVSAYHFCLNVSSPFSPPPLMAPKQRCESAAVKYAEPERTLLNHLGKKKSTFLLVRMIMKCKTLLQFSGSV